MPKDKPQNHEKQCSPRKFMYGSDVKKKEIKSHSKKMAKRKKRGYCKR